MKEKEKKKQDVRWQNNQEEPGLFRTVQRRVAGSLREKYTIRVGDISKRSRYSQGHVF